MNGIAAIPGSVEARMKCIEPITSSGPPSPVNILKISDESVTIAVDRPYIPGSSIELIFEHQVTFGAIESCVPAGLGFTLQIKRSPVVPLKDQD